MSLKGDDIGSTEPGACVPVGYLVAASVSARCLPMSNAVFVYLQIVK